MGAPAFEVAVIGRGMIGSAAARHLAEGGASIALVGGQEPSSYHDAEGPFASHYDRARITRISAGDELWAELAARSIGRYHDIATRSGVTFHEPCGLITASSNATEAIRIANERGGSAQPVSTSWVRETTGIQLAGASDMQVLFEGPPAGVIDPRALVSAQVVLAIQAGATAITKPATTITRTQTGFAITAGDVAIEATRLVMATGAYGAELVGVDLAIERRLRTVLHLELESDRALPSLIVERPESAHLDRLYWTPPVRYPDGRMMLKVGASVLPLEIAKGPTDIAAWFAAGGSVTEADALREAVHALLPNVIVRSSEHRPCVMAYTPSDHPFIGHVDDDVVVALGGNGSGAKGSDEMGRLAALTVSGGTDPLLKSLRPQLAG